MQSHIIDILLKSYDISDKIKSICNKVISRERISESEAIVLYYEAELSLLGVLADYVRRVSVGDVVTYNKNFHIEPTNICIKNCAFCSYRKREGEAEAWVKEIDDIEKVALSYVGRDVTEVHITGGVHPSRSLDYYTDLVGTIRRVLPNIHIKAFSAVELDEMARMNSLEISELLLTLKSAGLSSIPGGGAEIFRESVRESICPDKASSDRWLEIHKSAHEVGFKTNATMLYGLIESYEDRVDHMSRLRELQDKTGGFNTFIPLKFRRYNNRFSHVEESSVVEDMRSYAMSRIFLDNIPNIKAYWPMIGKGSAQMSLLYGVNDLDGTIDDSTKIYSMAGVEDQSPSATVDELEKIIVEAGRTPAERDSLFNIL